MDMILNPSDPSALERAVASLRGGGVVGMPTETVYGLAADATSPEAVSRIYQIKGRPLEHPVIVHIESLNVLGDWAIDVPAYAFELAEALWPGPITLILPRAPHVGNWITGGQSSIGLRSPSHPVAQLLLQQSAMGLAAPSANRFGRVSATTAADVAAELGAYLDPAHDLILDGGECNVGLESTIVDCTSVSPVVLRPGAITATEIEDVTGLSLATLSKVRAPGTLPQHYSPLAAVRLSGPITPGDGLIALSSLPTPDGVIRLASPATVTQYAHELYSALRKADHLEIPVVVAVPPEGEGLAAAIRDRLQRAAND